MNVYEASMNLGIWPMVKARAEIWSVTKPNESVFADFQEAIKNKYKELMMVHHPDKGGETEECIKVQKAYELLKFSNINHFIDALAQEKKCNAKFYKPDSPECTSCEKWSAMMGLCMTTTCTGFEQRENSKVGERFSILSSVKMTEQIAET